MLTPRAPVPPPHDPGPWEHIEDLWCPGRLPFAPEILRRVYTHRGPLRVVALCYGDRVEGPDPSTSAVQSPRVRVETRYVTGRSVQGIVGVLLRVYRVSEQFDGGPRC